MDEEIPAITVVVEAEATAPVERESTEEEDISAGDEACVASRKGWLAAAVESGGCGGSPRWL